MENDNVEMNIQVDSQVNNKGVDEAAKGMADIATNAEKAEKQVKGLSTAISQAGAIFSQVNKTIKPRMDLSEIEKTLASMKKQVDNDPNSTINMYSKNARQGWYQLSHLNRYTDWKENRRDTDPNWQQYLFRQSVQDRIEKGYKGKYTFDENSVKYAEKDLDLWAKRLNEEAGIALKKNLENSKKVIDKLYQEKITEPKKNYYQQQHNERFKNRYYEEQHNQRYEQWQSSPLSENEAMRLLMTGKFDVNSLIKRTEAWDSGETEAVLEKIEQAVKEREKIEKQKTEKTKEQLSVEQKITEAEEQEVQAAQESVNKRKPMTENQAKRNELAEKKLSLEEQELALSKERLEEQKKENERKQAKQNGGYEKFKNEHPELFAKRGGQYYDKKYQAAGVLSSVGGRLSSLGTGGRIIGDVLDTVGAFLRSPIAGAATAVTKLATAIIDLAESSIKAFSEIESIKTQLGVVFSNQTQADAMFGEISQYAVKSPFGVQQTSELAVLLKQSGVYASDLMDTLKMLGDTAGGNMEKMKRIANNYAQIVSIGKASMLDMRQFAYAGIPIFEAVSKELNVSQQELRKMISDGKVTSDIIAKVFKDLTGINGVFENATEKGAKTLKARLQNLQDAKQLMLSEFGDSIVNNGSTYGGDSSYLKLLSITESIFQWAKEKLNILNIERDVNIIARNNTKVEELKAVYEYAKQIGDKTLEQMAQAQLKAQQSLWGYDKTRNVLSSSYDVKNKDRLEFVEQFGEMTIEEIKKKIAEYNDRLEDERYHGINDQEVDDVTKTELENEARLYQTLIIELNAYIDAIKKARKATTEEEIKADRERNLQKEQQAAFDRVNTLSDASDSLVSKFQELNEIYKASDKYKEKKEAEKTESLKQALVYLKEISKNTDETGNVDITKMSAKEFNNLIKDKAVKAVTKLKVVNEDKRYSTEERTMLVSQYGGKQTQMEEYLEKSMGKWGDEYKKFIYDNFKLNNLGTKGRYSDTEFYNLFSELYYTNKDNIQTAIDKYAEKQRAEAKKASEKAPENTEAIIKQAEKNIENFTEEMREFEEALKNSINTYQIPNGAKDMDASEIDKNKNQFIALWKRIFASNTDLSTQGMENPRQTLDLYLTDVSQRKIVSNVMKATLDSMGVDAATNLLRPSGRQTALPDATNRYVNQIDWKKSADGLKDFATRLSASTDVVTAYTEGLEEEYEALSNLIVQGATELERQDLKDQKMVTLKQLNKLSEAGQGEAASQLVNALGNKIQTLDGGSVTYNNGKFYDEKGLEISQDQLRISDDIFDYLKQLLPDIKQQIAEGKMSSENNRMFSEQLQKVLPSVLSKMVNDSASSGRRDVSSFLIDHPEYLITQFYNAADVVLSRKKDENGSWQEEYSWIGDRNLNDIITTGLMADSEDVARLKELGLDNGVDDKAKDLLVEILEIVKQQASKLLYIGGVTSSYGNLQELERSQDMRDAALKTYRNAMGYGTEENYSSTAWADKGGKSLKNKIVNDLFGVDVGYTKEELFDVFKADAGLDMNTQLDKSIKKQLLWKVALEETKDVMQNLGDETASLVGTLGKKALTIPFEKLGETAMKFWSKSLSYEEASEECAENQKKAYRELGAEALNALAPIMQKAGFELVARGAVDDNLGMILGGLGLAAVGGFASGLGNALSNSSDDKTKDKVAKIQDLKDQLADLLEQARKDALYYENNLRHKTALGINKEFSYQSVHDAVITPEGDVITTDPKDYLIATKTPEQFAGGSTVIPIINCNVINNSSSKVRQEQQQNPDGSIDIITIIEDTIGNYIASPKSDDAFSARNSRIRGRQAIMS